MFFYSPNCMCVHITFTNKSSGDKSVSPGFFKCYMDNQVYGNTYLAGDDYLIFEELSSGRAYSGSLYYEIPLKYNSIELEYTPSYWSNTKRVIYKIK